ncbi:MAG: LysR family transcriptional regulator [Bifidobacterium scardovii]|uniref:LysR family transcriptional regulator n=1 Tax=Bifidobacterium scardovii TaxID=158787 RepID=UPI0009E39DC3|nr:LysR family transcriptional regulator [Bifidobacterium scardovii]MBS6947440.1 LysR family transcriptional regulator [Bifidobacterium scardovii]MDU3735940.1 LysR family transcriptional regulator [Bifidobacterium scardovii]MDU5296419.1 LysR family transcriptional regulator [Bifidobacterium scardovii]MDU5610922.1 LysR family transcriptional regulator [Bifidobacterium scardovii]MDU5886309.1 LysR family transcriptional regulator [Bifidobacterium scardovii]
MMSENLSTPSFDLHALRMFLAIAEESSISSAADLLRMSQPALSRNLKKLEQDLGVTLFTREARGIKLTPEGAFVRERAQAIVAMADRMERELHTVHSRLTGSVAIGCAETLSMTFLAERIAAFRIAHPDVRFDIRTMGAAQAKLLMEQGKLDMALLFEPVDMDRYDYVRMESNDRWGALMRSNHPLASKPFIRPKDLDGQALILPDRDAVRGLVMSWLGDWADTVTVAATANFLSNATVLVHTGVGIIIGIDIPTYDAQMHFIPLRPKLENSTLIAWKKGRPTSPAVSAFADFLRADS